MSVCETIPSQPEDIILSSIPALRFHMVASLISSICPRANISNHWLARSEASVLLETVQERATGELLGRLIQHDAACPAFLYKYISSPSYTRSHFEGVHHTSIFFEYYTICISGVLDFKGYMPTLGPGQAGSSGKQSNMQPSRRAVSGGRLSCPSFTLTETVYERGEAMAKVARVAAPMIASFILYLSCGRISCFRKYYFGYRRKS